MIHARFLGRRFGLSLGLLFFLLNLTPSAEAAAARATGLRTVALARKPGWNVSGATGPADTLLLIDALHSRIDQYSSSGAFVAEIKSPDDRFAFPKPTYIHPIPGGYLLESDEARFIRLDSKLVPSERIDLLAGSKGPRHEIGGIYQWIPLGNGDSILAFGDVHDADGSWSSGFLRVSLKNPAKFEIVKPMRLDDPARRFYLLGNPYLAALGDRGYFVLMGRSPSIYEIAADSAEPRPLSSLSMRKALGDRPQLTEQRGVHSYVALYASVEQARGFVSGLYTEGDALYLLKREGSTSWSLARVDPTSGNVEFSKQLPEISAHHLTVIPGPQEWAFVEKGAVVGPLQQDVSKVVFAASDLLESPER